MPRKFDCYNLRPISSTAKPPSYSTLSRPGLLMRVPYSLPNQRIPECSPKRFSKLNWNRIPDHPNDVGRIADELIMVWNALSAGCLSDRDKSTLLQVNVNDDCYETKARRMNPGKKRRERTEGCSTFPCFAVGSIRVIADWKSPCQSKRPYRPGAHCVLAAALKA
jgi:hypothetical protein